jgi:NAD(P)H-hydrate epimerase
VKLFSAERIRDWDNYTRINEPVSSIDLMERAAAACNQWLIENQFSKYAFKIFCGKGNNGGDGLAIARMLLENNSNVSIYILETGHLGSDDFQSNLARLHTYTGNIHFIQSEEFFPRISSDEIVIDALFGTGLNKSPSKIFSSLINQINQSGTTIISIDVPSGLYADKNSNENSVIRAAYTLTFQQYKLAFMMAENEPYFGKVVLLDINLDKNFYKQQDAVNELIDIDLIKTIYKPRKPFSHKGDYGHACLMVGSYGMMGAAVLAARSCLKSGVGKLTCIICEEGYNIMQISAPEAMCKVSGKNFIKDLDDPLNFNAIGVGPGIGEYELHKELLQYVFKYYNWPVVLDADGLNTIAENKEILASLPPSSILTPHPKEFDRLFGKSKNDFARMELALQKSEELKIYIVLKGHHTLIATPFKKSYFNSTGNAGMAKGGSGDILTGILTGLIAQGYQPLEACLLGVYIHGLAGDIAADKFSQDAMIAENIIDCIGNAYKQFV